MPETEGLTLVRRDREGTGVMVRLNALDGTIFRVVTVPRVEGKELCPQCGDRPVVTCAQCGGTGLANHFCGLPAVIRHHQTRRLFVFDGDYNYREVQAPLYIAYDAPGGGFALAHPENGPK